MGRGFDARGFAVEPPQKKRRPLWEPPASVSSCACCSVRACVSCFQRRAHRRVCYALSLALGDQAANAARSR